jgi:hypothetical protein
MRSPDADSGVPSQVMNIPAPLEVGHRSVRLRWFMAVGWVAIVIKCMLVAWAVDHWHMPFHASWVVVPTIAFAALASGVWLAHRE